MRSSISLVLISICFSVKIVPCYSPFIFLPVLYKVSGTYLVLNALIELRNASLEIKNSTPLITPSGNELILIFLIALEQRLIILATSPLVE